MTKYNYHTHTTFCDGSAPAEALVQEALEKGFSVLGFSGHSPLDAGEDWYMTETGAGEYRREIAALKEKYRGRIEILCGVEQDFFSEPPAEDYDFVIGSVHAVCKNGRRYSVDESPQATERALREAYGGSFDALAEDYFALVAQVCQKTRCDIIGHIDLVSKFCELGPYGESERYLRCAEAAVQALLPYDRPFEINTGAMARGYRTAPYPSPAIMEMIRRGGGSLIYSSDCHSLGYLDFGFEQALSYARAAGFSSLRRLDCDLPLPLDP